MCKGSIPARVSLAQGAVAAGGSPEEFGAYIRAETEKWAKVVKFAGLKAD